MDIQTSQNQNNPETFKASLADKANLTGQVLAELLGQQDRIPVRLREAMDYMLQSGGKRIRAALVMWTCETVASKLNRDAQIAAAAVEMVHTYSLIHDDLPAMDNDDMRRGRPSCHKQFDEATAILAGDALLTLAFEILSEKIEDAEIAVRMIRTLSRAAGPSGMIAGQAADMQYANTGGTLASLEYIHTNKTGAMFAASAALGAIAARASDRQIQTLLEYGMKIGLGFQIADDLLDITATSTQLGKTAGKDAAQGKLTYPALVGTEKSREIFEKLTCQAIAAVEDFGPQADILRQLARELLNRTQ
ncbi:MAG TPA: polyprenyl synthetase family protein [Anaerohalosphaeraceae bacterium]|nr:polyprenyl synthetase family protein [Phycisphaerae bacterium]HOK96508.1 polyprenyl synthetase family protein [Anaerohalosphaeraceae bacterium]HOL32764.1 polyprenyl synthetase family protein [Anaerohalosphaeraceae bacterium]HOM76126.1 polyprenyl synthetase family protein [Anaerohalosphaeraceae bacterium]HPC63746.1 polyprenyl synthetase family protein [Anaerohalosphaeraceae bacterium]